MSERNTSYEKTQVYRPTRGKIEEQRRSKLHAVLRDVRQTLDGATDDDRATMIEAVAPLVAAVVAEIAVLDRETDATDAQNVLIYGKLVADALDMQDEPWRAVWLWKSAAVEPLRQFGIAWSAYLERAARDSEGRHQHRKLVDLEQISRALNLTRPRIAAIFGKAKCSLPVLRLTDPTFSKEEQRDIRALSQRVGLSTEYLRDLALTLDPETFCDKILVLELQILPDIDQHRLLNSSDVSVSRSVRRFSKPRKPGPAPRADTRTAQIEALARHRRVSTRTIDRLVTDFHAWLETPENPDPTVTVAENCRHSGGEFPAVRFRDFGLISNLKLPENLTLSGVTITEADIIAIASLPWTEGPRSRARRKRYEYEDKDLVIAWWEATRNETPSPARIRKWAERGHYLGYRNSALLWNTETERRAKEDAGEQAVSRAA